MSGAEVSKSHQLPPNPVPGMMDAYRSMRDEIGVLPAISQLHGNLCAASGVSEERRMLAVTPLVRSELRKLDPRDPIADGLRKFYDKISIDETEVTTKGPIPVRPKLGSAKK